MFKVNQKVICIKPDADGDLVKDRIYIVSAIREGTGGIQVEGAICTGFNSGYFAEWRFRPFDDKWAEEVLRRIKEMIEKEKLVRV